MLHRYKILFSFATEMENFRVISGVLEGYSLLQEFHVTPTEFYIPDLPKKQKTRFARKLFFSFFFSIKILNFKTLNSQWSWRKLYLLKTFSILFFDNSNHILISSGFGSFFFQTSKPERTAGEADYHRNKVVSGYSWKLSNFGSLHEARFQSGFDDGVRFALGSVE